MSSSSLLRLTLACLLTIPLILVSGCQDLQSLLAGMDKPSVSVKSIDLAGLSLQKASLVFNLEVTNPYAVPLPLVDMDYALATSGTPGVSNQFLSGKAALAGTIPAKGSKVVQVPADVMFADLLKAAQGVKLGQVVPYTATANFSVDAPAVGRLSLPVQHDGQLPVPNVPDISVDQIQWTKLTVTDASATAKVHIHNTNQFPFDLNQIAYKLSLGGTQVGTGTLASPASFTPGGDQTIDLPISISPVSLGMGVFNMLSGKGSAYELAGSLSVGTPFGPLSMPYDRVGQTLFK